MPGRIGNFIHKEQLNTPSIFRDSAVEVKNTAEVDLAKNRIELMQVSHNDQMIFHDIFLWSEWEF